MPTKNFDYSERNQYALAHMVGQFAQMDIDVTLSDVSRWFGVSKYKAQKIINMLIDKGWVYEIRTDWRKNAIRKEYGMTIRGRAIFETRRFKYAYDCYVYQMIYEGVTIES